MPEITKVQITIRKFLFETRGAVRDPQKALEWLRSFRETLEFQDLVDSPNAYAMAVIEEARNFNDVQRKNSQMKQVKRALEQEGVKNPSRAQMESKWRAMYFPAEATTREDVENKSDGSDAANLESATSAGAGTLDSLTDKDKRSVFRRSTSGTMPPDKQTVYDFAAAEGLDLSDAYECWDCTVNERGGRTADGKKVTNWKAYVRSWCRTKSKRRSA